MAAYSPLEIKFLRLLKSCKKFLLTRNFEESDGCVVDPVDVARYQQYFHDLCLYADELRKRPVSDGGARGNAVSDDAGTNAVLARQVSDSQLSVHRQELDMMEQQLKRLKAQVARAAALSSASPGDVATESTRSSAGTTDTSGSVPLVTETAANVPDQLGKNFTTTEESREALFPRRRQIRGSRARGRKSGEHTGNVSEALQAQESAQNALTDELVGLARQFKQQQLELNEHMAADD
eukprot:SAG31_NODE_10944_length_1080_cov_1.139653_1_plen_236_part_01